MADDEDSEEPTVTLGAKQAVEGAPLARVSARLMWGIEKSAIIEREGETVVRTPDGPQELADLLGAVDHTYFATRQEFEDAVTEVLGDGPIPAESGDQEAEQETDSDDESSAADDAADPEASENDEAEDADDAEPEAAEDDAADEDKSEVEGEDAAGDETESEEADAEEGSEDEPDETAPDDDTEADNTAEDEE